MIDFQLLRALQSVNSGVFTNHWQPVKNMTGRQKSLKRSKKKKVYK